MNPRRSTVYRVFLVITSFALLGVAGFLGWKIFGPKAQMERRAAAAVSAYSRGLELSNKRDPQSIAAFDEAAGNCIQALKESDEKVKKFEAAGETPERGKLLWLFARILRDRAYEKANAAGKPIPFAFDSTTQEEYRVFSRIPEENDRKNAVAAVRDAARLLPGDLEVQIDALRNEFTLPKVDWPSLTAICERIIAMKPNDARAEYFLAVAHFEQFDAQGKPTPPEKRDAARMQRAREHLEKSKASGAAPPWRTMGLEVGITRWFVEQRKQRGEAARLEKFLFDPKTGVQATTDRPDAFKSLSRFDLAGVIDCHLQATELAEKTRPDDVPDLLASFVKAARLCLNLPQGDDAGSLLTSAAIQAVKNNLDRWKSLAKRDELLNVLSGLAEKGIAEGNVRPADLRRIAEILAIEPSRKKRAIEFLGEAQRLKPDAAEAGSIHLAALKLKEGGGETELRTHIDALLKSTDPEARGVAAYFDAILAMDSGNLDLAQRRLHEATRRPESGEFALRAAVILPDLHMAMGHSPEAGEFARELERIYGRITSSSSAMKEWTASYFRSLDEVTALSAAAQYDIACDKVEQVRKVEKDKPLPPGLTTSIEGSADRTLQRLSGKSNANRLARLAKYRFLAVTLPGTAKQEWDRLLTDYPDDPSVLRARFNLADPAVRRDLDVKLGKANLPELLRVEWLFASSRGNEARETIAKMKSADARSLTQFLGSAKLTDAAASLAARAFVREDGAFHFDRAAREVVQKGVRERSAKVFQKLTQNATFGLLAKEMREK